MFTYFEKSLSNCFFCETPSTWYDVGNCICMVRCKKCGFYLIDIDCEVECNDFKVKISKFLSKNKRNQSIVFGKLPYIACKNHIWGLWGRPYIFYPIRYILDL